MKQISFLILCFCLLSCSRSSGTDSSESTGVVPPPVPTARPMAILRTGGQPLWFQLTEDGPVHIESIEDAIFSAALIPWPLAPHIRFLYETEDGPVMAVNRDGFLKLIPGGTAESGIALYRFSGGEFFRQYTIGGFFFCGGKPAALLYLDDHFLDSPAPLPNPRTWTFNMESNTPFPLEIGALRSLSVEDGWSVDTLRAGADGLFYYRAARRSGAERPVRMFRTADLAHGGEEISIDVFYGSVPRQTEFYHPSLPPLPEGFFYTGIAAVSDSIFASWEEQEDFSIGAAGFVVIKPIRQPQS